MWRPLLRKERFPLARRSGDQRGQGLIELALVLPVLLAVVSAILDGGWALHQAGMVSSAAQAAERAVALQDTGAAHCAGAPPDSYLQTARSAAQTAAPDLNPRVLGVEVGYLDSACAGRMRVLTVSVTYPLVALTPWFTPLLNGRRVIGQANGVVEEVPPPWWAEGVQLQMQQAQIQVQQAQIASLTAAYQAEVVQAAALSEAVNYFYDQWQNASAAAHISWDRGGRNGNGAR